MSIQDMAVPDSKSSAKTEEQNQKAHLLIVEDEHDFAALMKFALLKEGYRVQAVESVEEAQDYLKREAVDLLITDWMLPDGNGGEVCAVARTTGRPVPVIVLSGALNERSQTIVECRPDVFMPKPIRMANLFMHIRELLSPSDD
jgi:DNA-binding response OmpR family regulator